MSNHAISLKGYTRGDNIFIFLNKFLGIIGRKWFGQPFWIMIWGYYYLLNRIRLDLDLGNSCCIQEYLPLLQRTLTFSLPHAKHSLT